MVRYAVGLLLGLPLWLVPAPGRAQESLERGLLRQAPRLIKYFKEQGYKNVGVLKFLVAREGESFTDNVGTLNLLVARRLELALILANDPRAPIGITANASEVARTIAGASHLSKEGRQKLFQAQYPLAWGKETVQPDAFITGTAQIGKDLRKLTMTLYSFDRASGKLQPVGDDFHVENAPDRMTEMGESFVLRGVFDDGQVELAQTKVFDEAVKVHEQQTKHPALLAQAPVTLEVTYDGRKVAVEFRGGKAYLPEPREGQSVELALRRDGGKERYGVVLKVNGENTLDRQRLPDLSCRKWVLEPGGGPWAIRGYQHGDKVLERFRVASVAESRQREVNYGHDVGTITLTVFREQKRKPRPQFEDEQQQYQTVVTKLTELPKRPNNYQALKAQLLEDANRGLIVEGQREPSQVETVAFVADPLPIMGLTIVYYHKQP